MGWISNNAVRAKYEDLSGYSLAEIAEMLVDLESEKEDLETQVSDLTRERDELAAQVEDD